MARLSVFTWIINAAAVFTGTRGTVSARARQAQCSRQTIYQHARNVRQAVIDSQHTGPSRDDLLRQVQALRAEVASLRARLATRLRVDPPRRRQLAGRASAMGLSFGQIAELFQVPWRGQPADVTARPPSRATVGRWVRQASRRAGQVLAILDAHARPLAGQLCVDELFVNGRPILVGVEPHGMAVLLCRRSADRTGATWLEALRPFTGLAHAVADAGTGVRGGLAALGRERAASPGTASTLTIGLDVFHVEHAARRELARCWRWVEKCWDRAERSAAEARTAATETARHKWECAAREYQQELERQWQQYETLEQAWRRAKAALRLFRPDGRLNDRGWAEAELQAACTVLAGPSWSKVRNQLKDPRMLHFLDRMHAELTRAEPRAELREALAELWRLEQRRGRGAILSSIVQGQVCRALAADWREAYRRVEGVLGKVVRASSAVECVNSVLRMQQCRHRNVSQEMLDLKRLYWNCRAMREGKRRGSCAYEHLGLPLPSYRFWDLIESDPAQLTQELSTPPVAA